MTEPRTSWALLCMHKAASDYVGNLLAPLFAAAGFETLNIDGLAFEKGIHEADYPCAT